MTKPAYRIPSTAELTGRAKDSGLTVASTFSGAGGSSLGLAWAGLSTVYASEFIPEARDVYRRNRPGIPVDDRDIREVSAADVLTLAGVDHIDVLEGSPPCASFSSAGKRDKGWGQERAYSSTRQRTDDLFDEYARLLGELRPRAFVAENVPGLAKGKAKGYYRRVIDALRGAGYRVGARILDAQWLGVPQRRKRLIIVGLRGDVAGGAAPPFPDPLPYRYSIADACPWLAGHVLERDGHGYFPGDVTHMDRQPYPTVAASKYLNRIKPATIRGRRASGFTEADVDPGEVMHTVLASDPEQTRWQVDGGAVPPTDAELAEASVAGYAIADEWQRLKPNEVSRKYLNLIRLDHSRPSATITQTAGIRGAAGPVLDEGPRKFTIGELRRVCGFPDDFELTGSYAQQWERLGRAVPPPMMRAVGEALAKVLT